jgi:hypothetical protein
MGLKETISYSMAKLIIEFLGTMFLTILFLCSQGNLAIQS